MVVIAAGEARERPLGWVEVLHRLEHVVGLPEEGTIVERVRDGDHPHPGGLGRRHTVGRVFEHKDATKVRLLHALHMGRYPQSASTRQR